MTLKDCWDCCECGGECEGECTWVFHCDPGVPLLAPTAGDDAFTVDEDVVDFPLDVLDNDSSNGGGISIQASQDLNIVASKNMRTLIQGEHRIGVVDGDFRLNVKKGACHINAKQQIRLRVGSSWIEINPDEIILNAKHIKLEA